MAGTQGAANRHAGSFTYFSLEKLNNKNKLFFISYFDVQSICYADTLELKKDDKAKGEIAEHKQMRPET